MVRVGVFFLLLLGPQAYPQDDWAHAYLKSAGEDVYQISVDFRVGRYTFSPGEFWLANPVWINISQPKLHANNKVRVVLLNFPEASTSDKPGVASEIFTIDLTYQGSNRFSGDIPFGMKTSIRQHKQELAVVIDGNWLKVKKPSGEMISNFDFNMEDLEKERSRALPQ